MVSNTIYTLFTAKGDIIVHNTLRHLAIHTSEHCSREITKNYVTSREYSREIAKFQLVKFHGK